MALCWPAGIGGVQKGRLLSLSEDGLQNRRTIELRAAVHNSNRRNTVCQQQVGVLIFERLSRKIPFLARIAHADADDVIKEVV